MIDFKSVILDEKLTDVLIGQAAREGILSKGINTDFRPRYRSSRAKQNALSLLILFDRILIPWPEGSDTCPTIPSLESEGLMRTIRFDLLKTASLDPSNDPYPKIRGWDVDRRARQLERTILTRHFVLNRLTAIKGMEFGLVDFVSLLTGMSRRAVFNSLLDYALAFYRGNKEEMKSNPLSKRLPFDLVDVIRKNLLKKPRRPEDESVSTIEGIFVLAFGFSIWAEALQDLSATYKSVVASQDIMGGGKGKKSSMSLKPNALDLAKGFCLLRCALHEEGRYFPKIDSIKSALALRKDPHLRALKEQLFLFHSHLPVGDGKTLIQLRREVRKAKDALERTKTWGKRLDWSTYISLPVSVVGLLNPFGSVIGMFLSILSIWDNKRIKQSRRKNEWVLFGS